MSDLKKGEQRGAGQTAHVGQPGADRSEQEGQDREGRSASTRGTNRDFDESNQSRNQGHGHPREERG